MRALPVLLAALLLPALALAVPCGGSGRDCLVWYGCSTAAPLPALAPLAAPDACPPRGATSHVAIARCNGTVASAPLAAPPPPASLNASCPPLAPWGGPGDAPLAGDCAAGTVAVYAWSALDACGACNGTAECEDCRGVPWGPARRDRCGLCGGDGSSCGDPACPVGQRLDACRVCGGNNSTCTDAGCAPGVRRDACGACGGDSSGCLDCAGRVNGTEMYDSCFRCGGRGRSACGLCHETAACRVARGTLAVRALVRARDVGAYRDALPDGSRLVSSDRVTNGGGKFHGVPLAVAWDVVALVPGPPDGCAAAAGAALAAGAEPGSVSCTPPSAPAAAGGGRVAGAAARPAAAPPLAALLAAAAAAWALAA